MKVIVLAASAPVESIVPAPQSGSSRLLWWVAAPCVLFVLYLLVDAIRGWIRNRRMLKYQEIMSKAARAAEASPSAGTENVRQF